MADLTELMTNRADEGATMTLMDPKSDLTRPYRRDQADPESAPITITCLGRDSKVWRRMQHAQQSRRLTAAMRKGKMKFDAEAAAADALDLLVACVVDWDGIELEGKPWPCTEANRRKLLAGCEWMREQIDEFVDDRATYLGEGSPNS